MAQESLLQQIREKLKKYLKWYFYPLVYFAVVGLVCAYAWYNNPITQRAGIKIIFKTIGVIPTLLLGGVISLWLGVVIFSMVFALWLKRTCPQFYYAKGVQWFLESSGVIEGQSISSPEEKASKNVRQKVTGSVIYGVSLLLIGSGLVLGVWITRPYITLLLSSSKIGALEKKASSGQLQGNRIIIPSALVDAPIIEGVSKSNLSKGVCRISDSSSPGKGGNCIIEGHNLAEFGWWRAQSFFSLLEIVGKGTPVYVFYDGKKYVYKVKDKTYREISDPELYNFSPGERLTLITCVSTWSPTIYTNRRTVITAYPDVNKNQVLEKSVGKEKSAELEQ
jgi:LPXTG-site transpeptidase (sortase) family protein